VSGKARRSSGSGPRHVARAADDDDDDDDDDENDHWAAAAALGLLLGDCDD